MNFNHGESRARESQIELLRCILMIVIVVHHLLVHGAGAGYFSSMSMSFSTIQKLFVESFALFPVDCFVIISGFYGISLKPSKLVSFWFQCAMYSVVFALIGLMAKAYTIKMLVWSLFPISSGLWWFATSYFVLMLGSPFLNVISKTLSKSQFYYLLSILAFLNIVIRSVANSSIAGTPGSSIVDFIFLYFIGQFMKLHIDIKSLKLRNVCAIYVFMGLLLFSTTSLLVISGHGAKMWSLHMYNNPMIIAQAICIFFAFKLIPIKSRCINRLGSLSFGVYLIHDHEYVRSIMLKWLPNINSASEHVYFIVYLIFFALAIFAICSMIEYVRVSVYASLASVINRYHSTKMASTLWAKLINGLK